MDSARRLAAELPVADARAVIDATAWERLIGFGCREAQHRRRLKAVAGNDAAGALIRVLHHGRRSDRLAGAVEHPAVNIVLLDADLAEPAMPLPALLANHTVEFAFSEHRAMDGHDRIAIDDDCDLLIRNLHTRVGVEDGIGDAVILKNIQ